MSTKMYSIKNRMKRQVNIDLSEDGDTSNTFVIPPDRLTKMKLTRDQFVNLKELYGKNLLIRVLKD